jgi:hypothetical protein
MEQLCHLAAGFSPKKNLNVFEVLLLRLFYSLPGRRVELFVFLW